MPFVAWFSMPFRYRLIDAQGTDLGAFVSKRQDWKPGERMVEVGDTRC
jgi:hypothetical protein